MLEYSVLYPVNTVSRQVLSLDGMWRFKIDWDSAGREEKWQEGLSGFDMIPVPASFQDFYTDKEIREFVGDVWYETDVMVSSVYKEKGIFLVWLRHSFCPGVCKRTAGRGPRRRISAVFHGYLRAGGI